MKFTALTLLVVTILTSCKTPEQNARLGQLVTLAVAVAEQRGTLSAADAQAIREAKTIVLPPETALPVVEVTSGK